MNTTSVSVLLTKLEWENMLDVPGPVIVEEKLEAPDIDLDLELRKF